MVGDGGRYKKRQKRENNGPSEKPDLVADLSGGEVGEQAELRRHGASRHGAAVID